jgi:C4-dicarboxylate-specific signal transduction histidine kinase
MLYLALPPGRQDPFTLTLTLVMLGWVTWASDSLASLLKRVGEYLGQLNAALTRQQGELERRIAERTAELEQALGADSGNRERSIRSIMNTGSGDHERLLAHACMGSGERRMS